MGNDTGLSAGDRQRLFDIAEPVYREIIKAPFDMTMWGDFDFTDHTVEDELGVLYASERTYYVMVRIMLADDSGWTSPLKLSEVFNNPEQCFRSSALGIKSQQGVFPMHPIPSISWREAIMMAYHAACASMWLLASRSSR